MFYKVVKLEPVKNLSSMHSLEYIDDKLNGLFICLKEVGYNNLKINILFENGFNSYRVIDRDISDLNIDFEDKKIDRLELCSWTFFKVINSKYSELLSKMSYGIYDKSEFEHYLFCCSNALIEVVVDKNVEYKIIKNI